MEWFYHTKGTDIDLGNLQNIVDNNIPMHQHLQFITGDKFSASESDLNRLSKLVSAMANSGGGIIIIGIDHSRNKAKSFNTIPEQIANTEQIHHYLIANNQPFIEGLNLYPILISDNNYCVCIQIPAGIGPFMFSDNKYYGFNNKIEKLNESSVRALYHRTTDKQLEIFSIYDTQGLPELSNGKFTIMRFYPKVLIRNSGFAMEDKYKMEILLPATLYEKDTNLVNHFSHHEGKNVVFSFPGKTIVFSKEVHKMLEFKFIITPENIETFEKSDLQIRLYYSSGTQNQTYPLKDLFTYQGKMITKQDFI
jgi:hypothetical protein